MTTHPLDGTAWRLIAYQSGKGWVETPPEVTMTLCFDPPLAGGQSAVNGYAGRVTLGGVGKGTGDGADEHTFRLTNISCSAMAGPESLMTLEMRYFRLLEGACTWRAEEERLTLQDAEGETVLHYVPDANT